MPTQEEASEYFLKNKQEQLGYLIASTLRIEKGVGHPNSKPGEPGKNHGTKIL